MTQIRDVLPEVCSDGWEGPCRKPDRPHCQEGNGGADDIWGDAVNLAARLEGLSQPGRILMCPNCKAFIEDAFAFESLGLVEVKGVGKQEAWFLIGNLEDGLKPEPPSLKSVG